MKYDPRLLLSSYARLAPRERLLLGTAALSVVLISLYSFVWEPLQASRTRIAQRITMKEKDLAEIQKERQAYLELQRRIETNQAALNPGDPSFSLFPYLNAAVGQAVGREHVTSMNPADKNIPGTDFQEQLVEIHLTQISLPQLVDIMYRIEKGDHPLRFSRLQIKKRHNDIRNFDVSATVSVLKAVTQ